MKKLWGAAFCATRRQEMMNEDEQVAQRSFSLTTP
jgi:hypothetical protein